MIGCSHRPPCPGCPRFGDPAIDPAKLTRLRAFCAESGAPEPRVFGGSASGHRHRARLAVRGRASSPKLGIFQESSHRIADIPTCPVHHPAINVAAAAVRRAIRASGAAPFAERPHKGLVRYAQFVVERRSERVQLTLVVNTDDLEEAAPLVAALVAEAGDSLHGLWLNANTGRGNAILGPSWSHAAGAEWVVERIGGAEVFFHPGAFGQANLIVADRLVEHVHELVGSAPVVAELYAGCGAIGLGLAARGSEVRFNEVSPHGIAGLRRGLDALGRDAVVHAGPADEAEAILDGAAVVVVDPPRKGVGPELLERLKRHRGRLVAVYCGFDAFVNEIGALVSAGWGLDSADAFDLFPFTDHVEVVAALSSP